MTKMGDFEFGTVNVANVAPLSTDVVGGSGRRRWNRNRRHNQDS